MTGQRYFESAELTRLNSAHWTYAQDVSINDWLVSQLATIRARAIYESRNNGIVLGMINTHAEDVVGQDGPTLQIQSSDGAYNEAGERVWRDWFAAPTQRPNVSGASLLKLWVRNLWRCGEFLARIITLPDQEGPVGLRLLPIHPRRLASLFGDSNIIMGIRFDSLNRPSQYYITEQSLSLSGAVQSTTAIPYPPDLIIHEFILEEEDQVRGVPLLNTAIQPSADLRDYDDQIQDAARQSADQHGMLYTVNPNVEPYTMPETTDIERRTYKMAPPGWQPFVYPATMPPVQYPDYRGERQLEFGRPASMPRLLVRLDASKHSWASARLDMTTYRRSVACLQAWLSGSEKSVGVLNRLVDEVLREARFSVPELRDRPLDVIYQWTWPQIDDVEPEKTESANQIGLTNATLTLTDVLTRKKKTLRTHVEEMRRERETFKLAGVDPPPWMKGEEAEESVATESSAEDDDDMESEVEEAVNA
jgi:hypothetical protein